jgi:hypothetical protein
LPIGHRSVDILAMKQYLWFDHIGNPRAVATYVEILRDNHITILEAGNIEVLFELLNIDQANPDDQLIEVLQEVMLRHNVQT